MNTIATDSDAIVAELESKQAEMQADLDAAKQSQSDERKAKRDELISGIVDEFAADLLKLVPESVLKRLADVGCVAVNVSDKGITPILAAEVKPTSASGNRDLVGPFALIATPEQKTWLAEEKRIKPTSGGMAHAFLLKVIDDGYKGVPEGHGRTG